MKRQIARVTHVQMLKYIIYLFYKCLKIFSDAEVLKHTASDNLIMLNGLTGAHNEISGIREDGLLLEE